MEGCWIGESIQNKGFASIQQGKVLWFFTVIIRLQKDLSAMHTSASWEFYFNHHTHSELFYYQIAIYKGDRSYNSIATFTEY